MVTKSPSVDRAAGGRGAHRMSVGAKFTRLGKARPRIGVLVSELFDEYQTAILQGARDAAMARDVGLYCFVGGELLGTESLRNRIFDFVGRENVDALAIIVGAIGNKCSTAQL